MRHISVLIAMGLIAASCGSAAATRTPTTSTIDVAEDPPTDDASVASATPSGPEQTCSEPLPDEVYLVDTSTLADPALGNVDLPGGYQPFDDRAGPQSAYTPCYVSASDALFDDETIVIGVEIDGAAKAYSRSQLIAHLVNDHFGTTPILVAY